MPIQYTAGQLIQTYQWAVAHPDGTIRLGRRVWPTESLTSKEWLGWFRRCVLKKIHAHDPPLGRKGTLEYQWGLARDARRIHDYTQRRCIDPINRLETPELQRRFQWRYSEDGVSLMRDTPTYSSTT